MSEGARRTKFVRRVVHRPNPPVSRQLQFENPPVISEEKCVLLVPTALHALNDHPHLDTTGIVEEIPGSQTLEVTGENDAVKEDGTDVEADHKRKEDVASEENFPPASDSSKEAANVEKEPNDIETGKQQLQYPPSLPPSLEEGEIADSDEEVVGEVVIEEVVIEEVVNGNGRSEGCATTESVPDQDAEDALFKEHEASPARETAFDKLMTSHLKGKVESAKTAPITNTDSANEDGKFSECGSESRLVIVSPSRSRSPKAVDGTEGTMNESFASMLSMDLEVDDPLLEAVLQSCLNDLDQNANLTVDGPNEDCAPKPTVHLHDTTKGSVKKRSRNDSHERGTPPSPEEPFDSDVDDDPGDGEENDKEQGALELEEGVDENLPKDDAGPSTVDGSDNERNAIQLEHSEVVADEKVMEPAAVIEVEEDAPKSTGDLEIARLSQTAVVNVTTCEYAEKIGEIMPIIRTQCEKEQFYTGFNRFRTPPDKMYDLLKKLLTFVPDKPPTNGLHGKTLKILLDYEKGFTANPGKPDEDTEKFSWLVGAKLQSCMELHDKLVKKSIYYDSEETNWENVPAVKLGLLMRKKEKTEPDTYIPTAREDYKGWPKLKDDLVYDVQSIARQIILNKKKVPCFQVHSGFPVRVDLHKKVIKIIELYVKASINKKRINRYNQTLQLWGLFMFFPGPSGDPDTVFDSRLDSTVTDYHQKRIDVFLDYLGICWDPATQHVITQKMVKEADVPKIKPFNRDLMNKNFKRALNHMRDMKRSKFAKQLECRAWYYKEYKQRIMTRFKNGKVGFDMTLLDKFRKDTGARAQKRRSSKTVDEIDEMTVDEEGIDRRRSRRHAESSKKTTGAYVEGPSDDDDFKDEENERKAKKTPKPRKTKNNGADVQSKRKTVKKPKLTEEEQRKNNDDNGNDAASTNSGLEFDNKRPSTKKKTEKAISGPSALFSNPDVRKFTSNNEVQPLQEKFPNRNKSKQIPKASKENRKRSVSNDSTEESVGGQPGQKKTCVDSVAEEARENSPEAPDSRSSSKKEDNVRVTSNNENPSTIRDEIMKEISGKFATKEEMAKTIDDSVRKSNNDLFLRLQQILPPQNQPQKMAE